MELTLYDGCILWGSQLLVPELGREAVLQKLHCGHPGITKIDGTTCVQILKQGFDESGSMEQRIAKVLMTYRMTPHSTTGVSPSELLLGRKLRSRLDLHRPNCAQRFEQK